MRNSNLIGYALTLGAAAALAGCQNDRNSDRGDDTVRVRTTTTTQRSDTRMGREAAPLAADAERGAKTATATIEPSKAPGQDEVRGTVHFASTANGVRVTANITGLEPNSKHGFHIHEKADLSAPDLASAGGHFNPTGHKHGGPEGTDRHGGDLGNLTADASGKATYEATIPGITIDDPKTGIVGHSVIIHEKPDDLKSDPSGNSGARIAGGVIKAGSGSSTNR
jgi:Cu-Zn family superoxide dismutase